SLHVSDLYATLQGVEGVAFADVNRFLWKRPPGFSNAQFTAYVLGRGGALLVGGAPAPVQEHLRIFAARPNPASPGAPFPAELAALETPADDLLLTVTTP